MSASEDAGSPEAGVPGAVSLLVWVLGMKLFSSFAKALDALSW